MRKAIKKRELVVILALVLLSLAAWLFFNRGGGQDRIAKIIQDGRVIHQIDLSRHTGTDVYHIEAEQPVTIEVREDAIGFVDSRCPDHLCERTGLISRPTQTAVCLPLKVAVVIESREQTEVDMIAK